MKMSDEKKPYNQFKTALYEHNKDMTVHLCCFDTVLKNLDYLHSKRIIIEGA